MTVPRPFRFAATLPAPARPLSAWHGEVRRLEDLGVDTLVAADHFTQGYAAEPMVALTAAAGATTRVRLQTGVLGNDYRHPVLVHRMAALLDVVSDGRFVLGLGAGWMTSDYEAAGIALDEPAVRVDRFEESLQVLKGLFGDAPFTFDGRFYRVHELDGLPKPVQRPHPPFFVGGGSPRVLRIAGREADVAGVNASLRAGELGEHAIRDLSCERVLRKVGWVREGAAAAGRDPDSIELEMNHWLARVTPTVADAEDFLGRVAARYGVDAALLAESPSVLVGTVEQCVETLQARRERFGFNVLQLDAGFPNPGIADFAPVIAALSGT
ncbi:MAG TPA: TIGR03621 family F420-dependent LLM class oxidoreductase [Acidimicrobiia bacterium]|nr:TIGR03621 family F420-dependent LLM class oxidoreductase [Acidimicrobiia bacterium]